MRISDWFRPWARFAEPQPPDEAKRQRMARAGGHLPWSKYDDLLDSETNPGNVSLNDYQTMIERDPVVRFAYDFIRSGVSRRIGQLMHPNERIKDFAERNIMPAIHRSSADPLSAIYYGVSISEPIYSVVDGQWIGLDRLHTTPPERFFDNEGFRRGTDGALKEVQISGKLGMPEWMPIGGPMGPRLIIFSFGDDFSNPWGRPAARAAYPAWVIKHNLQKWEALGLEKHALPGAIFRVPNFGGSNNPGADVLASYAAMGSDFAMVIDTQDDLNKTVKFVESAFQSGSPFSDVIQRLDEYICMSFYQPALLSRSAQYGTYSQANVQLGTYLVVEDQTARVFAEEVLLRQVIRPLLWMNFGPESEPDLARIEILDGKPVDDSRFSQNLVFLQNVGALNVEVAEQARWIQENIGIPMEQAIREKKLKRPEQQSGSPPKAQPSSNL